MPNECDQFPLGSRQRDICNGVSGLPRSRENNFRRLHNLPPLPDVEQVADRNQSATKVATVAITALKQNNQTPRRCCGKSSRTQTVERRLRGGPGTRLIAIFKTAGFEACEACYQLAEKMDAWGDSECESRLSEIVADILPRALEWEQSKLGWWAKLVPQAVTTEAVAMLVRSALKPPPVLHAGKRSPRSRAAKIVRTAQQARPPLVTQNIDRERLKTHILYHILPLAGDSEPIWRRHVDWLREVRGQFNGRMIVGILTPGKNRIGQTFVPASEVKDALAGLSAEFVVRPNDHVRGEGMTFRLMLNEIQTDDPDEVFFYGHSKGVTRPNNLLHEPPHLWASAMFDTLFRNRDNVVSALDHAGIAGPFRHVGGSADGPGIGPHWFYSGTFFAARCVNVFRRNWRHLLEHYGCVEQWPRFMFDCHTEAACVFFDQVSNLYDATYWCETITPAIEAWRAEHLATASAVDRRFASGAVTPDRHERIVS